MIAPSFMRVEVSIVRFLPALLLQLVLSTAIAQENRPGYRAFERFSFVLLREDTTYAMPHQFLMENTEVVLLDSLQHLTRGKDYSIDYRHGVLGFSPQWIESVLGDTLKPHRRIFVTYERYPFAFRDNYSRRQLIIREDTVHGDTLTISKPSPSLTIDEIFGPDLQKSGSLVRGFSFGTNRDLSVSSGFRMQLSGKIATDVEVTAALTDENTPIQPEGNTQTLQEIDKVSVEIKSPNVAATIGDFQFSTVGTEFGRMNRKLQGARGIADYRIGSSRGNSVFLGAVTRGKFHTNQFQGLEGVQGPYRLIGRNGERNIIIIAGTERVYVDGEITSRGETNDYIIDYASGEVTFRPRRLITSASRIVIDFEYTDRFYSRTLLVARTESELGTENVKVTASYFRESDNENSTIDISLSDADRGILRQSGGDRFTASKSGAVFVGRDSLTNLAKGQYVKVDTLIETQPYTYYRYAPGDPAALYSVSFSFVGVGQGDYVKESIGNFRWVGLKKGTYLPLQFLPFPQLHDVADLSVNAQLTDYLSIKGEYAFSRFDVNKFSSLDDMDNSGSAVKFALAASPKVLKVGGRNLGSLDLELKERFVNRRFRPIDRTNDIEFNRKWNLEHDLVQDEEIREGNITYRPVADLSIGAGLGSIDRGGIFSSTRRELFLSLRDKRLPRLDYRLEDISSEDSLLDRAAGWTRHRGSAEYSLGAVLPGFGYEGENKESRSLSTDSLRTGSFRYHEFSPRIDIPNIFGMSLRSEFRVRNEDSLLSGGLQRAFQSFSQTYQWRLREWKNFSSAVDLTLRQTDFTDEFKNRGNTDVETFLLRTQSRFFPLNRSIDTDLFYEVATQRSAKLERVFVRVPRGTGNYRYRGDLNGNGIADESEFELTRFDGDFIVITVPTDALFPVIDLKAGSRIRLTPSRILFAPESFLGRILRSLSLETYLRVEERSSEKDLKQIYLLRLSRFQNDSTTILGSKQITQDLFLFENDPDLSFRFRFSQRSGFTQFALARERSLAIERSVRIRSRLVREIATQFDVTRRVDRLTASRPTNRERNISSTALVGDFSYRPEQNIEVGFRFGVSRSTDSFPLRPLTANINDETLRMIYAFETKGQLRVELTREEVTLDRRVTEYPFELTSGKLVGKSWLWRLNLDYRLTNFVQATMGYDGRSEGGRRAVHSARAEVRAFF